MAERYCPSCGTRADAGAEACASCGRNLPGTAARRRENAGKRKWARWAIVLGLGITVASFYFFEGGPRIVDTRRGPSTATAIKVQAILTGLAFAGYAAYSLYQLRDDD